MKADIRFGNGSIHRCVGRVINGQTAHFADEADVRRHIARVNEKQGGEVLRLVRMVSA
jgi:hypothetical protein